MKGLRFHLGLTQALHVILPFNRLTVICSAAFSRSITAMFFLVILSWIYVNEAEGHLSRLRPKEVNGIHKFVLLLIRKSKTDLF